jgi:hypothetical protein
MSKERHWKLLAACTTSKPIESNVKVKQYLTLAHVDLLDRIIAVDEVHVDFLAVLTDSGVFDPEILREAADKLGEALTLLAGCVTLSATPIHD